MNLEYANKQFRFYMIGACVIMPLTVILAFIYATPVDAWLQVPFILIFGFQARFYWQEKQKEMARITSNNLEGSP
jgi:hypothetical protein